jgi:DNA-binding beta-propeller fold protein YncE
MPDQALDPDPARRRLVSSLLTFGLLGVGGIAGCSKGLPPTPANRDAKGNWHRLRSAATIGPLRDADANGLRLPAGFASRVVARSGQVVGDTGYVWHAAPDGGATFATGDGGWVYVSNAEIPGPGGGVSALRFDATARVVGAYAICAGTARNCAGGATPWGTWLTCEEVDLGRVIECDPLGQRKPMVLDALGWFAHEAAAVDPSTGYVYMTEDQRDGRFYRLRPNARGDLRAGVLEVARLSGAGPFDVTWLPVPNANPDPADLPTRRQVDASTAFVGGEGAWWHDGIAYITTKGDDRVWAYDAAVSRMHVVYDPRRSTRPAASGVDNVTVSPDGRLCVAEDGGHMQVCVLDATGQAAPLLQVVGHAGSELAGIAFSPDGSRLYVSSQRGPTGRSRDGVTFEVMGPFGSA